MSGIPPTLWPTMWQDCEENVSLNEDAFCQEISHFIDLSLKCHVSTLTATFFETGAYGIRTKSQNPTVLGSGDPTSTQKSNFSGFCNCSAVIIPSENNTVINFILKAVEAEEDEEEDLQSEDISPHALHLAFNRPRQDVFRVDQNARTLEKVKQTLQVVHKSTKKFGKKFTL